MSCKCGNASCAHVTAVTVNEGGLLGPAVQQDLAEKLAVEFAMAASNGGS
jgi:hypothetical protein